MDDDLKMLLACLCVVALLVLGCVAINVGTAHSCKVDAIAAGMNRRKFRRLANEQQRRV